MADESQHDFGYANFSSNNDNPPMQSFVPSNELFGLQAGMEMLGLPNSQNHDSANPTNPEPWISFFPRADSNSSVGGDESLMFGSAAATAVSNSWRQQQEPNRMMLDDSPLRCLFPTQGGQEHPQQQPSRGLSLSLHNPQRKPYQDFPSDSRDGLFFPAMYWLKGSMYLAPAQELLNEFCSLGGETSSKLKSRKVNQLFQEGGSSSSLSMDFQQLQKRKAKLLSMVEELDRKYKKYREQMRAVVSSFEAVVGEGAAMAYSTLSSKAMSRHFRSLRDGIVSEIQETKKAMGEKDPVIPGITKGETPRLKMLDRRIRQQKAFQQGGAMESHPWRPQRGLPERSVTVLRAWLFEHFLHPYPSDVDKHILSRQTGLSRSQVSNWFINARVRLWKPMVEEMYVEETKEVQDNQSSEGTAEQEDNDNNSGRPSQLLQSVQNPNPSVSEDDDQKPLLGRHLHIGSDSLSSIVDSGTPCLGGREHRGWQQPRPENFGVVNLDFSSYNQNIGGGNTGVSLTLGLQQHAGAAMSLSFSQTSQQQSIFFSRDQMEDCQPVQFSIIDGEAQNLPCRNLMGAQLLRDLAG